MLIVTERATQELKRILQERGSPDSPVRIFIIDPCSKQYTLLVDDNVNGVDSVLEQGGVKIVMDPISATLFNGATMDYIEGRNGRSGFRIALSDFCNSDSCACGGRCKQDSCPHNH